MRLFGFSATIRAGTLSAAAVDNQRGIDSDPGLGLVMRLPDASRPQPLLRQYDLTTGH